MIKKANFVILFHLLFLNILLNSDNKKHNVGLLVMATGKYISFVPSLIESAEKYFCKDNKVTYFIFTDSCDFYHEKAIKIYQSKLGWPYDTLMRFAVYNKNKDKLAQMDYLYACDADMLFMDEVGDEILSDLVGTFHPGFYKRNIELPYERNEISQACVKKQVDKYYFAGGFYGGSRSSVLKLLEITSGYIEEDLQNFGYIAVWHDESYLNKYFIVNPPTKMLSPSYCFPEDAERLSHDDYKNIINLPRKLIALVKKDPTQLHNYNWVG